MRFSVRLHRIPAICLVAVLVCGLLRADRLADTMLENDLPPLLVNATRMAGGLSGATALANGVDHLVSLLCRLDRQRPQAGDEVQAPTPPAAPPGLAQAHAPFDAARYDARHWQGTLLLVHSHGAQGNAADGPPKDDATPVQDGPDDEAPSKAASAGASSAPGLAEASSPAKAENQPMPTPAVNAEPDPTPEVPAKTEEPAKAGDAAKAESSAKPELPQKGGVGAEAEPPATAQSAKKPPKRRSIFEKPLSRRYRVLLVGDSFMEEITLAVWRSFYGKDPNVEFISVAKHSTGLCVSTRYSWPRNLETFMRQHKPDVVMVFIGANDLQNIIDGRRRYTFTTEAWKKRYVELAEEIIDIIRQGNAEPLWIGMPVMGTKPLSTWMPLITSMQRQACLNRNAEFVDTVPTLADAEGNYQIYMTLPTGKTVRVRKEDKYHISFEGSMLILAQVVPSLKRHILEREEGRSAQGGTSAKPQ